MQKKSLYLEFVHLLVQKNKKLQKNFSRNSTLFKHTQDETHNKYNHDYTYNDIPFITSSCKLKLIL